MIRAGPGRLFAASTAGAACLLAWLYVRDAPLRVGLEADAQHHLAAVRELARGEMPPRHNLVAEPGLPQGHYGPYLVLLGTLARWTQADPLRVLYAAGVVNLALFAIALRALAERALGPGCGRWATLAALLLWGPWPGLTLAWPTWRWPGTTSLADAQNFFYPQQAGSLLLLVLITLLLAPWPLQPRRSALVALVTAGLITTHPLSALAALPALAALGAERALRREAAPPQIGRLALPLVAGVLLALAWPWYPVLGLLKAAAHPGLRQPVVAVAGPARAAPAASPAPSPSVRAPVLAPQPAQHASGPARRVRPAPGDEPRLPLLPILGPALAGLAGAALLALRGAPFLAFWLLADLAASACPLLPLRQRFVLFAALPAQLGACWLFEQAWRRGWLARACVLGLLGAGALSAAVRVGWLLEQEVPQLAFVQRLTPEDAIVLADPPTSNGVAGLAGRKVVAPEHPDLFFVAAGGWERINDVARFLAAGTAAAERERILRRWRVTHVLLDRLATPLDLPYPVLAETGGYVLYEVGARP